MLYAAEDAGDAAVAAPVLDAYRKALRMYKLGNWETAIGYFQEALAAAPGDPLCALCLERCRKYRENPPPGDWDGSMQLDFK